MSSRFPRLVIALGVCAAAAIPGVHAQIDPEPRNLLELGVSQAIDGDGPNAAYAFYYWNLPGVPATNTTLRLAIAPVYLDAELGFKGLLGEHTDVGVELFGGGFYNSYYEVQDGDYHRSESFNGNGGGAALSLYHNFTPAATIPLNGVFRVGMNYHAFNDTSDTADGFRLPENQPFYMLRTGLRWGGMEPLLAPRLAMEVAAWYELSYRPDPGAYGFPGGDWDLNSASHQFLGSARVMYTFPRSEQYFVLSLVGGAVIDADRFSAYRLGGALPFSAEYPFIIPGYYYQELSAQDFAMLSGVYAFPLGRFKRWSIFGGGAVAVVNYLDGLEQPGDWNSGVTGGVTYTSPNNRLKVVGAFGYGINAIRDEDRGGYSVALMLQYNFGRSTRFASDRAFENLQRARLPFRFSQ